MKLTRLIYASNHDGITAETLDRILQTSRANNVRDGITGALVIGEYQFLQLLEGDRSAIGRCMMSVMQDIAITASRSSEQVRSHFDCSMNEACTAPRRAA